MDPEKFSKKKMDDLFKSMNFLFTVPVNAIPSLKKETVEQMLTRLDSVDETVNAMTSYPVAERMLNNLFNKEI